MAEKNTFGIVSRIQGAIIDVKFDLSNMPGIYEALEIELNGKILTLETELELENAEVRAIAMGPTEGLRRGAKVKRTGSPIQVPVGPETLGRIFNVLGNTIDGGKTIPASVKKDSIHKEILYSSLKTERRYSASLAKTGAPTFQTRSARAIRERPNRLYARCFRSNRYFRETATTTC